MIDLYQPMWRKTHYLPFYPILCTHCGVAGQSVTYSTNSHWVLVCQAPNQIVWLQRCPWEENGVPERQDLWSEDCIPSPTSQHPSLDFQQVPQLATMISGTDGDRLALGLRMPPGPGTHQILNKCSLKEEN